MRTICIANQKGGCGKTTVAVNLGSALANAGVRVLLVDNDPQAHATLAFGYRARDFERTTRDLYLRPDVRVEHLAQEVKANLHLVPGAVDLSTVETSLENDSLRVRRLVQRFAVSHLPYDCILLDNPPHVGTLTFNALMAAGEVLVPVDPGRFSSDAVARLCETLQLLDVERGHRLRVHLLPNGFDVRTRLERENLEELASRYPGSMLETRVRRSVRLREAAAQGVPVDRLESDGAAADFQALAEELWNLSVELSGEDLAHWDDLLHGPRCGSEGVRFEARFPGAHAVAVTGDFTDWSIQGVALTAHDEDLWSVEVPLQPGVFEYKFIVDGVWKVDPENPERVRNSYGQLNSVLTVPGSADLL